jgi:hypothetical protein
VGGQFAYIAGFGELRFNLVDEHTRRRYHRTMPTNIEAPGGLIDDLFELSSLETVEAMKPQGQAKRVAVRADRMSPSPQPAPTPRSFSGCCSTGLRHR